MVRQVLPKALLYWFGRMANVITIQHCGIKDVERSLEWNGVAYLRRPHFTSRGDWTRTSDPLHPMQVRYRAALHPEFSFSRIEHHTAWPFIGSGCVTPEGAANVTKEQERSADWISCPKGPPTDRVQSELWNTKPSEKQKVLSPQFPANVQINAKRRIAV